MGKVKDVGVNPTLRCGCFYWARDKMQLLTRHHKNCEHYNPEGDAAEIINALLDGIMIWAADEDGVHYKCWDAYKNAAYFVGRSEIVKES